MTFFEFNRCSKKGWYTKEELPEDVKTDLQNRLEKNDHRIGFYIYHSHDSEGCFHGMKVGYYVRTIIPQFYAKDKMWKSRRIVGGL